MSKRQPAIKTQQVRSCNVSNLITPKKDLKLSLHKCSNKTKIRDSSFDILLG